MHEQTGADQLHNTRTRELKPIASRNAICTETEGSFFQSERDPTGEVEAKVKLKLALTKDTD